MSLVLLLRYNVLTGTFNKKLQHIAYQNNQLHEVKLKKIVFRQYALSAANLVEVYLYSPGWGIGITDTCGEGRMKLCDLIFEWQLSHCSVGRNIGNPETVG